MLRALIALAVLALCPAARAQQILGAGASFPAPVYAKWAEAARAAIGVDVSYRPIGSTGGQNEIANRGIDFGASDVPMDPDRLATASLLQFPTVMGAVVVIVNLPRVREGELKLTGDTLADIFAGKIKKWNDPRLVGINPDFTLPNLTIAPVHRFEASGTSFVFTSYLSAVSPDWKREVGAGANVKWPVGAGAKGSDGVASTVAIIHGGIGYVESSFATENHLATARLRNRSGVFVKPTAESFVAASVSGDWSTPNFAVSLVNTQGEASWPIVSATFVLVPKEPPDAARGGAVLKFFDWAYRAGGAAAEHLGYIPLPAEVQESVRAAWRAQVLVEGKPVFQ